MKRAAVLALALAAAPALAASSPDLQFEEELAELSPSLESSTLRGHHLRRSHPHKSLLKYDHNVHHRHHVTLDEMFEDADTPMKLPGRHPSVEKALDGMSGDLETLKEEKQMAQEVRQGLEGTMTDAVHHMNDATSIKHLMEKEETKLRIESGKLQTLQADVSKLGETKESLMESLQRMLHPKIMFARERLEKKEVVFRKEEEKAKAWREKKDMLKDAAMEVIKQKKASHQIFLEAEEEVARAKKKEEGARMQYDRDRKTTGEKVQSYRYAETRYKAEEQHEKAAKEAAMHARESVEKLYNVEHVEADKVDQSILYRKEKLRRKMEQVEAVREKSRHELTDLEQKYRDWQQNQRERTADVVRKSQETQAASEAYAARQQQVLDTASAKVTHEAEAGDWDAWGGDAGMFTKVKDEDDE